MRHLHRIMLGIGQQIAGLWMAAFGIVILLIFPIVMILVASLCGYWTAEWIGGGRPLMFVVAVVVGLLLTVYVHLPYAHPAALRAAEALMEKP